MPSRICRFGPYALDLRREELQREGETIHVMPKMFALLVYLIEHRDRLVTKEELLDAIWADAHVAEGSLVRTITNLRQALGDDAGEPRFIETVSRRGYRFIAAVDELQEAAADSKESPYALVHDHRAWRLRLGENVLGRAEESVVPITSFAVSRRHAMIEVTGTSAIVRDLGSKNGTIVADRRITEPVPLREGDEIRLGPLRFLFIVARNLRWTTTERMTG